MECFKTEVPKLTNLDASTNSTKPNKESLEFAIVTLIRTFSGQAEAFRSYLQAGPSARSPAGLAALTRLVNEVYPGQLAALAAKQQASPAYRRDVMLQAAAIVTDLQWLAADVLALTSGADSTGQQEALEGYITFAEETLRRSLYWLFYLQFDGPPAHLPGPLPSSAASTAVISAFEDLAAAALPSRVVAADAPAWQQLQVMTATAAGSAAAAAAQFGAELDGNLVLSNAVAGLAKAHVQDLWGSRLELARNGASPAGRQLALRDPNEKSARWEPLRRQQVNMLVALQQLAAAGRGSEGSAANQRLAQSLQELVAASGAYLLTADDAAAQQQKQRALSASLGLSARLAQLIRQCHGSPAGLPALTPAAAAKAGVPAAAAAACTELSTLTAKLAAVGGDGIIGSTLSADLDRQWRCNAVPAKACASKPGCALALAPVLVPAVPAAAGADNLTLSCQASDGSLFISSLDSSAKSALAVSQACDQFLKLPACEATPSAAACSSSPSCRWEPSAQRNILHTASASPKVAAAAGAGSSGVCTMDWVALLTGTGGSSAYSGLTSMIQLCQGIADPGQCESQTMLITLDPPAPGGSSMARFWVPALVVAAVAGVLLFGAAIWWRRHSAAARRAADEARAAAGGGRGGGRKGGKDGKGGKGAKGTSKKKPKRAEPGSYKPDLMRDSFTDYMRAAPQQFHNGVAIAKAAMATGGLDTAVAVADVAGARQLSPREGGPQHQQQQQAAYSNSQHHGPGRTPSPGSDGSWGLSVGPAGSVPRSQGSSDLIDLSQSDVSGHNSGEQQPGFAYSSSLSGPAGGGSSGGPGAAVWGSAAAGVGLAGSPGLVSPRGYGFGGGQQQGAAGAGRAGLQGDMSVPVNLLDANASIALTSSINLVSSLPHHSSLPIPGLMSDSQHQHHQQQQQQMGGLQVQRDVQMGLLGQQQQQVPTGAGAARANFGAPSSLARISGSSSAYAGRSGSGAFENAHSGSLLLPSAASRGQPAGPAVAASEDGCTTPTSSCCHDSVCTFGPGPGSVVSAAGSAGSGRPSGVGVRPGQRGQGQVGASGLAAAPSVPLSRSSWSSAVSTDLLMSTQHSSAIVDP
jgi:hypothetical protein